MPTTQGRPLHGLQFNPLTTTTMKSNIYACYSTSTASLTIPDNAPKLRAFAFAPGVPIRLLIQDGKPLFLSRDVCKALGYANLTQTLQDHVSPADRLLVSMGAVDLRNVPRAVITLTGIRALFAGSKKAAAAPLLKWIDDVVLPGLNPVASAPPVDALKTEDIFAVMDFKQLIAHIQAMQAKAVETIAADAVKRWAACH